MIKLYDKRNVYLLLTGCLIIAGLKFISQEYGINSVDLRDPFFDGVFPTNGASTDWKVDRVYENIREDLSGYNFTNLAKFPGRDELLLVSQEGKAWTIEDGEEPVLVFDISERVASYFDAGLYQIAFHPEFGLEDSSHKNEVYVFYTYAFEPVEEPTDPIYDRLSRFEYDPDTHSIDPDSEVILISQYDRHQAHNGGSMFFDKEGYLFVSLGDEGRQRNYFGNAQKIDEALFSGVIRIDVDMDGSRSHPIRRQPVEREREEGFPPSVTQNYFIPNDNPWLSEEGEFLEEFYAIGFRSPHTMHYDTLTDQIFVADVGQSGETAAEEVNIVEKGTNAQWAYKEGENSGYSDEPEDILGIETPPIHYYGRDEGYAIIGGGVYRGNKFSDLVGHYLFADYVTQTVWSLDISTFEVQVVCRTPVSSIVGFYLDNDSDGDGNILILTLNGDIYQLEPNIQPEFPQFLSETGVFSNLSSLEPSEGLIPYDVNSPLWSDGASKQRWVSIPAGEDKIVVKEDLDWNFPVGTVFVKHFDLFVSESESIKLETRFMVAADDGTFYGVTYKWNEEGTDAEILEGEESVELFIENELLKSGGQTWSFPSRSQCLTCHNSNAGFVLGVNSRQLNKNFEYPTSEIVSNQIETWNHLGLYENSYENLDEQKLVPLLDSIASDELKVRSYLDANCAFCHRPGGVVESFDARFMTKLVNQNMVDNLAVSHNSQVGNYLIHAADTTSSEIWIRDASIGENMMPPIGKSILDTAYLEVLQSWIFSLGETTQTIEESICNGESYSTSHNMNITAKVSIDTTIIDTLQFSNRFGYDSIRIYHIEVVNCNLSSIESLTSYPNPTRESKFYLVSEDFFEVDKLKIEISDMLGHPLNFQYQHRENVIAVELSDRAYKGMLIVRVNNKSLRVIIQ